MECENRFCIYESNGECILDKISIDSLGFCADCLLPDIDEETLKSAKSKLLKKYDSLYNDIDT